MVPLFIKHQEHDKLPLLLDDVDREIVTNWARSRALTGSRMEPNVSLVQPALTDEQWLLIADLFAGPKPKPRGGRPRVDARR